MVFSTLSSLCRYAARPSSLCPAAPPLLAPGTAVAIEESSCFLMATCCPWYRPSYTFEKFPPPTCFISFRSSRSSSAALRVERERGRARPVHTVPPTRARVSAEPRAVSPSTRTLSVHTTPYTSTARGSPVFFDPFSLFVLRYFNFWYFSSPPTHTRHTLLFFFLSSSWYIRLWMYYKYHQFST